MKLQSKYHWYRGAASLLLLCGYFLNLVSFESFHQVIHHHEHSELHTEEAEKDACHRAIYHGETSHNCNHKSHLTETHNACGLCEVGTPRSSEFLVEELVKIAARNSDSAVFSFHLAVVVKLLLLQSLLRGPPMA